MAFGLIAIYYMIKILCVSPTLGHIIIPLMGFVLHIVIFATVNIIFNISNDTYVMWSAAIRLQAVITLAILARDVFRMWVT